MAYKEVGNDCTEAQCLNLTLWKHLKFLVLAVLLLSRLCTLSKFTLRPLNKTKKASNQGNTNSIVKLNLHRCLSFITQANPADEADHRYNSHS